MDREKVHCEYCSKHKLHFWWLFQNRGFSKFFTSKGIQLKALIIAFSCSFLATPFKKLFRKVYEIWYRQVLDWFVSGHAKITIFLSYLFPFEIHIWFWPLFLQAVDARSLAKSRPEFIRTSMLTFFNNCADDLEKTIVNLHEGKWAHLRGTHLKVRNFHHISSNEKMSIVVFEGVIICIGAYFRHAPLSNTCSKSWSPSWCRLSTIWRSTSTVRTFWLTRSRSGHSHTILILWPSAGKAS